MASNHGYDVSHFLWMGTKTYAELVHELLQSRPGTLKCELVRGLLDPNDVRLRFPDIGNDASRCFTIGFRHPNFHPLASDPADIWNMQCVNLTTGAISYDSGLPGLSGQTFCDAGELLAAAKKLAASGSRVPPGRHTSLTIQDLHLLGKSALDDYLEGRGEPCYGFVLRSRQPGVTRGCSDILCDSSLLSMVRRLAYSRPFKGDRRFVHPSTFQRYNMLRAFLGPHRAQALRLFPQFAPLAEQCDELIAQIHRHVVALRRATEMYPDAGPPRTADDRARCVARQILKGIMHRFPQFSVFDAARTNTIVSSVLNDTAHAALYLEAIIAGESGPEEA